MTVADLIAELRKWDPSAFVVINRGEYHAVEVRSLREVHGIELDQNVVDIEVEVGLPQGLLPFVPWRRSFPAGVATTDGPLRPEDAW